jgi:hypothetical protein
VPIFGGKAMPVFLVVPEDIEILRIKNYSIDLKSDSGPAFDLSFTGVFCKCRNLLIEPFSFGIMFSGQIIYHVSYRKY